MAWTSSACMTPWFKRVRCVFCSDPQKFVDEKDSGEGAEHFRAARRPVTVVHTASISGKPVVELPEMEAGGSWVTTGADTPVAGGGSGKVETTGGTLGSGSGSRAGWVRNEYVHLFAQGIRQQFCMEALVSKEPESGGLKIIMSDPQQQCNHADGERNHRKVPNAHAEHE